MATQTQSQPDSRNENPDWRETPFDPANFVEWLEKNIGALLFSLGAVIVIFGFFFLYTDEDRTFRTIVADLYANGGAELMSIAITVLVVDKLAERREIKRLKDRLRHEAGSQSNERAKAAIDDLRDEGWLDLLAGANLSGANLRNANLRYANLQSADLSFANLQSADLSFANLQSASLRSADLQGANLVEANLEDADLWRANLDGADLVSANLKEANLVSANLEGAHLEFANIQGVNLLDANLKRSKLEGTDFDETTILPDAKVVRQDEPGILWSSCYDVIKGPEQMYRFTDPTHPDFWRSDLPPSPAYNGDDT